LLDHRRIDWDRVGRVSFLLRQRFRYDYDGPISRLRHRLMVVPPAVHGDQRRVDFSLEAAGDPVELAESLDAFGNHRADVRAAHLEQGMEFETWALVERAGDGDGVTRLDRASLDDPRLLEPTPLTWPDEALRAAARRLGADGRTGLALAQAISDWVYGIMRYRHDVTTVDTTAARALGLAQGVCQDYSHVMLAVCRISGLPARYVSGPLLGEGGSHAWVEVLVPATDGGGAVAVAFDPTNGRRAGMNYLTVAVGRDYGDVAPTSGTYQGTPVGLLTTTKRLGVTAVDLRP